ncbi:hypothetical protein [Zoogloea sp.]|uniref:hypothetical protein n=1 Tax=Zoogloea sp. TaxID=49181 RepID=UPI00260BF32F|nr:hypothetical protein [uncultured Zoogloea sp.]MCK6388462.1 hypothetical protein [Zoogloea sp.]
MTEAPKAELEIPLEDEDADPLFEKADALIQRHASFAIESELDDLPVLTDVVEPPPPVAAAEAEPAPSAAAEPPLPDLAAAIAAAAQAEADRLAERLVVLDSAINRHIQDWVATELPQLVSRELDDLAERLQAAAASHLRATLLPLISGEIADTLDKGPEA